jgi:dTDP-4-dehydrorhamnose reductase
MNKSKDNLEIWGGIECTLNRVGDSYHDQLQFSNHYERNLKDIKLIADLGIRTLRYPFLWEKYQPEKEGEIDWTFAEKMIGAMEERGIVPIAGLVHHGSGPAYVNFFDGSFEEGLAEYSRKLIQKFPSLEYFTPVNEPLTTARFCGLYGHWYPHLKDDFHFYRILLSECKATVLAMKEIRKVNPDAKLIQTEDLSKCYSTPLLAYQATFENHRRWLSYDLLCGRVDQHHFMWKYMVKAGVAANDILYFQENFCVPDIAGFNYYLTSERYLDEDLELYPKEFHGGNGKHRYADIHTVHVPLIEENGPALLLKEAYAHLKLPLAITECHLHSTREGQMRWFNVMWKTVKKLKEKGIPVQAITSWAFFGLYGWNKLCTQPGGTYEPGVFNLRSGFPKPTALARLIKGLTARQSYQHPVLEKEGWWQRKSRLQFGAALPDSNSEKTTPTECRPLLILGKTGTLGTAFSRVCEMRNIHVVSLGREELDFQDPSQIEAVLLEHQPWAVINAVGYVRVDDAECDAESCLHVNAEAAAYLAASCAKFKTPFLTFSTDLVFDGNKKTPYLESDSINPLNVYGQSKAIAEGKVQANNPNAIIVRTSSFFGPWDRHNFVYHALSTLAKGEIFTAAEDVFMTATYVPDLVNECLDLLLDGSEGIFHVTNYGKISWAELARKAAKAGGYDPDLVKGIALNQLNFPAVRPIYSVLQSEKGLLLPTLTDALRRFMLENETIKRYAPDVVEKI